MPVLKNAKREAFAQAIAAGKTADEAQAQAGYTKNHGNATRLKSNEVIVKRVAEIRAKVSEKAEWSAAERLIALKEIHDATKAEEPKTAISAISEANKMQGSYAPAKHEHSGKDGGPVQTLDISKLAGMEDEELDALERALVKLGASAGNQSGETEKGSRGGAVSLHQGGLAQS